jgi:hypothetical protein
VVATREVREGACARRGIADGGVGIGLPVIPRREISHATEWFSAPLAVHEAAKPPFPVIRVGAQERGGVEAVVCARGCEGSRAGLAARGVGGSQDGGDVEGGFRGAELPRVG